MNKNLNIYSIDNLKLKSLNLKHCAKVKYKILDKL